MKNKQKQLDAYFDMLDDTLGKNEFTLLELIRELNLNLTISQQSRLGINISKFSKARGIGYTKVRQTENNRVLTVNSYPIDSKHLIIAQVRRFLEQSPGATGVKRKRIRYQKVERV